MLSLASSQDRHSLLYRAISMAPVIFFVIDKEGIVLQSDGRGMELLGLRPGDYTGECIFDIYKEATEFKSDIQEALAGNTLTSIAKIGNIHLETRFEPIRDTEGNVVGVVGMSVDVTGRYIIEKELQENYEILNSLVEGTDDVIFLKDVHGRYQRINRAGTSFLGLSDEDIIGRTNSELHFPPEFVREVESCERQILSNGAAVTIENLLKGRVFMATMGAIRNPGGRTIAIYGIARDITNLKLAEQESKLNEQRLAALHELSMMEDSSAIEIATYALEKAIELTCSSIGFISTVNEADGTITIFSWSSDVMSECNVKEKTLVLSIKDGGIWTEAIRQRRPVIINEYTAPNPLKKGTPEGHVKLERFLCVPVLEKGSVVGLAAVANRASNYEGRDEKQLLLLMEGVWHHFRRKKNEEEKQGSRVLLDSIIEATLDGIMVEGKDSRMLHYNRRFAELWQVPDELLEKNDGSSLLRHMIKKVKRPEEFLNMIQELYGSDDYCHDYVSLRDGRVFKRYTRPLEGNGGLAARVWIFRDITERFKARLMLKGSEERYRKLFHESPVSLWEEDLSETKKYLDELKESGVEDMGLYLREHPECLVKCVSGIRVLDVNKATLDIYEADSNKDLIENLQNIFPAESHNAMIKHLLLISAGAVSGEIETIQKTLRDRQLNVIVRWHVPPGHEDSYSRVIVAVTDITEQKRTEDSLKMFERIVSSSSDLMASFDRDYVCTSANDAFSRTISHSLEETRGRTASDIWGADEFEDYVKHNLDECMRGKELRKEKWLDTKHSGRRYFDFAFMPCFEPDGSINGTIINGRDISDLKAANEDLMASEQRFKTLFEDSPSSIMVQDYTRVMEYLDSLRRFGVRDFNSYFEKHPHEISKCLDLARHISVNRAAREYFKLDAETAGEKRKKDFLPETYMSFRRFLVSLADGKTTFEDETLCRGMDGQFLNIVVKISLLPPSDDGRVTAIVTHTDITDIRNAETELFLNIKKKEAEKAKTEGIISALTDGLTIIDKGYRILFQNNESIRMVGDIKGRICYEAITGRDGICDDCPIERTFIDGLSHSSKKRMFSENGEHYYENRSSPILDRNGEIVSAVEITRDVTSRHLMEKMLIESEENIRLLLDSTAEAIYELDLEGNCIMCNPACLKALGYSSLNDLEGKNMHEVLHHTQPDGQPCPMQNCRIFEGMRTGQGAHVDDEVFWKADGSSFPVEYWSYPIRRNGNIVGSVVTFLDITERRENERALLRTLEEKETLIREMNHRVKNNLLVLQSMLRLQSGKMKSTEAEAVLKDSESRIRSMSLLHDQLYMTRDLKSILFSDYVKRLVGSLHNSYMREGERVDVDVILPEVCFDVDLVIPLGLILNELASNAFKYAFRERSTGVLTVRMEECREAQYILTVMDDGAGLPEDLDIHNTSSMGMQIVTALVDQIKGDLDITRGAGTAFRITFRSSHP